MKVRSRYFEIIAQGDILLDLARKYVSLVSFLMIGVMFFKGLSFGLVINILLGVLIVLVVCALAYLDWKFIYPRKLIKLSRNNPATRQLLKNTGDGEIEY